MPPHCVDVWLCVHGSVQHGNAFYQCFLEKPSTLLLFVITHSWFFPPPSCEEAALPLSILEMLSIRMICLMQLLREKRHCKSQSAAARIFLTVASSSIRRIYRDQKKWNQSLGISSQRFGVNIFLRSQDIWSFYKCWFRGWGCSMTLNKLWRPCEFFTSFHRMKIVITSVPEGHSKTLSQSHPKPRVLPLTPHFRDIMALWLSRAKVCHWARHKCSLSKVHMKFAIWDMAQHYTFSEFFIIKPPNKLISLLTETPRPEIDGSDRETSKIKSSHH